MAIIKDKGIVLRYVNINDSDRIVTVLTEHNGKVEAVAKGCRKPRSPLLHGTQTFAVCNFIFYQGHNLDKLTQGELVQSFYSLHNDLTLLAYGMYFVELSDAVALRDIPMRELFVLLCNALYYMSAHPAQAKWYKLGFQLKLAQFAGIRPVISYCANCGAEVPCTRFSIKAGGVICPRCYAQFLDSARLGEAAIQTMKLLYGSKLSEIEGLTLDPRALTHLDRLMNEFLETHLDQKFKSLDFLEGLPEAP